MVLSALLDKGAVGENANVLGIECGHVSPHLLGDAGAVPRQCELSCSVHCGLVLAWLPVLAACNTAPLHNLTFEHAISNA